MSTNNPEQLLSVQWTFYAPHCTPLIKIYL